MNLSGLMHESTQYPYNKDYIWPSNREIYQLPNQSLISFWIIKSMTVIKL